MNEFRRVLLRYPWFELLIAMIHYEGRHPTRQELILIKKIRHFVKVQNFPFACLFMGSWKFLIKPLDLDQNQNQVNNSGYIYSLVFMSTLVIPQGMNVDQNFKLHQPRSQAQISLNYAFLINNHPFNGYIQVGDTYIFVFLYYDGMKFGHGCRPWEN